MTDKELITKILEVWETKGMCKAFRGATAEGLFCEPRSPRCTSVCLVGATQIINGVDFYAAYNTREVAQLTRLLGREPQLWFDSHMDYGTSPDEIKRLLKATVGL